MLLTVVTSYSTTWRLLYIPIIGTATLSVVTIVVFKATQPDIEVQSSYRKCICPAMMTRSAPDLRGGRQPEFVRDTPPRVYLNNTRHLQPHMKKMKCKHGSRFHWYTLPRRRWLFVTHRKSKFQCTLPRPRVRMRYDDRKADAMFVPHLNDAMINNYYLNRELPEHQFYQSSLFGASRRSLYGRRSSIMSDMSLVSQRRRIQRLRWEIKACEMYEELQRRNAKTGYTPQQSPTGTPSTRLSQRSKIINDAIIKYWLSPYDPTEGTVVLHV
ncbi:uncharacterized protein LOC111273939 isoform X1 [Varroa jacobsoni]|nr:uncharacterized protein LOC111273939 isoform X1 [Varroa jacobsoni]